MPTSTNSETSHELLTYGIVSGGLLVLLLLFIAGRYDYYMPSLTLFSYPLINGVLTTGLALRNAYRGGSTIVTVLLPVFGLVAAGLIYTISVTRFPNTTGTELLIAAIIGGVLGVGAEIAGRYLRRKLSPAS